MMLAFGICLFFLSIPDKEGNLVDMKVDARQLDKLERIIKKLSK